MACWPQMFLLRIHEVNLIQFFFFINRQQQKNNRTKGRGWNGCKRDADQVKNTFPLIINIQ